MTETLFLNFAIITAVIVCLVCLQNPLALFGLLLLKEMPYALMMQSMMQSSDDEEEESKPMGFIR
jgi:hypothetical protein